MKGVDAADVKKKCERRGKQSLEKKKKAEGGVVKLERKSKKSPNHQISEASTDLVGDLNQRRGGKGGRGGGLKRC